MYYKLGKTLLLVLAVLSILLPAGCAGGSPETEDEKYMGRQDAPIVNAERVAIQFYFPGAQPKSWPEVKARIEEEISGSINATLDFKWLEFQQYFQRMSVLDASQESLDAFCLAKPERHYPDFTRLAREGKLKDITGLFPVNAPGLMAKYTREELNYGKVDGKLYAVPSLYPHAYATYLMLDDSLLKKYNISGVTNYQQYEAFLKTVKENEKDLIPGIIANGIDTLKLFARGAGYVIADDVQKLVYKWDDPKMKLQAWEKTPEFKEAVYYIADWFKKGYLVSVNNELDQSKVASFVYYGELNPPSEMTTKMTFSTASGDFKESNPLRIFYLYPEKKVQRDNPAGTFFFNGSFVFPAASPNTERALQFLDWVQKNRDNHYLMMYGIEGKDYVLGKDSDYPVLPEGMDFNNRTYLYWDGNWAFRNIEYMPVPKDKDGNEMESQKQFIEKNSKYAPHGALYPNYENVRTTADNRSAKFTEFETRIYSGSLKDTLEVDSFIRQMEALGSDNLVAEVQKQVDKGNQAK